VNQLRRYAEQPLICRDQSRFELLGQGHGQSAWHFSTGDDRSNKCQALLPATIGFSTEQHFVQRQGGNDDGHVAIEIAVFQFQCRLGSLFVDEPLEQDRRVQNQRHRLSRNLRRMATESNPASGWPYRFRNASMRSEALRIAARFLTRDLISCSTLILAGAMKSPPAKKCSTAATEDQTPQRIAEPFVTYANRSDGLRFRQHEAGRFSFERDGRRPTSREPAIDRAAVTSRLRSHVRSAFARRRTTLQHIENSTPGLAIAQTIIQSHGGRVALQSTEHVGTTVTVHLPARTEHGPHSASLIQTGETPRSEVQS